MTENKPLSHISIQIATPAGDAKFDREYVLPLMNTIFLFQELGATADWANLPGCADLSLARAKILSNFIRSSHTHLMMIDSDMGWEPQDVVNLVMLNRDFVGAAGPKKVYKVEFAFNNCCDDGSGLPIHYEADTGIMDITEMGMAFVLITKKCAERMIEAYADLEFDGKDGHSDYAVFDPLIVPGTRRRLSEDYAFCYRWRKIGGKVHLVPHIRLFHVGRHIWQGALSDTFNHREQQEKSS